MAPERIAGDEYSYASDIWGFGMALVTVATGQYPYEDGKKGYWALMHSIQEDPPPTLSPDFFSDTFIDFIALVFKILIIYIFELIIYKLIETIINILVYGKRSFRSKFGRYTPPTSFCRFPYYT